MPGEPVPISFRYQEALAPLVRRVSEPEIQRRLSQVLTLLDFNSTLNQSLELGEILDLVLYVSMGETRSSWAGILLRGQDDRIRPAARRGRSDPEWASFSFDIEGELTESWERELQTKTRSALVSPLRKGGRLVGVLLLGDRAEPYGVEEREFAETLSVSAAASIDNGRIYEELQEVNRKLSFKVYQLNSLFDITRELNRSPDVHRVRDVLVTNALGQVLTTKAVLLQEGAVVAEGGAPLSPEDRAALEAASSALQGLGDDRRVSEIVDGGKAFMAHFCWVLGPRGSRSRKKIATSSDRSPRRRRRPSTTSVCRASGSKNRKSKKRWRSPARSRGRSFPTAPLRSPAGTSPGSTSLVSRWEGITSTTSSAAKASTGSSSPTSREREPGPRSSWPRSRRRSGHSGASARSRFRIWRSA